MNVDIEDLETQLTTVHKSFNLNTLKISDSQLKEVEADDKDRNFEDIVDEGEEIDEDISSDDAKVNWKEYCAIITYRYQKHVSANVQTLLNKKGSVLSVKKPSPLIKYLIFSNLASFVYYSRLWNGELYVENDDGGIPCEEAISIV